MLKITQKTLAVVMIAALVFVPFGSAALAAEYFESEEPGGAEMIFDFVLVRPIGIIATAVGSVFFLVTLPFSVIGDNVGVAGEKLVSEPAAYTFKRPLGEF